MSSTPSARRTPDAPLLHDDVGSNVIWNGHFDWGDYDAALAEADQVVRIKRLHFDRFSSTPLETSGGARRVQPRHRAVDDPLRTTSSPASRSS